MAEGRGLAGTTRRAVLAGAVLGGAGLAGCGGKSSSPPPGPVAVPTPDPDTRLLAEVLAAKRALLSRYAATVDRFPGLATGLGAARADHEGHIRALAASPLAPPGAAATSPPTPPTLPGASPTPSTPAVPADRAAAVRALAAAEREAAEERVGHCLAARDADLARLLASVGACEAAHGLLLADLAGVAAA